MAKLLLQKLLEDGEVKSVIFLVPPYMYSFRETAGYGNDTTRNEFDYFLNHPELTKKVYLVFGAYEMVNKYNFNFDNLTNHGDIPSLGNLRENADVRLSGEFKDFVDKIFQE